MITYTEEELRALAERVVSLIMEDEELKRCTIGDLIVILGVTCFYLGTVAREIIAEGNP